MVGVAVMLGDQASHAPFGWSSTGLVGPGRAAPSTGIGPKRFFLKDSGPSPITVFPGTSIRAISLV